MAKVTINLIRENPQCEVVIHVYNVKLVKAQYPEYENNS